MLSKTFRIFALGLLAILPSSCCRVALAQIELSASTLQVYSGFENPRIVGDLLFADPDSQPQARSAALITIGGKKYKNIDIEAERLPDLEIGRMVEVSEHSWLLAEPGRYRVSVFGFDPGFSRARIIVEVGPAPPVPPGPGPGPGPTPGPTPTPTPTPTPDTPAPIPLPGLRVMMVYESQDLPRLSEAAKSAMFSAAVRSYLDSHCVRDPGNQLPQRVWIDQHATFGPDAQVWKTALARGQKSLPWIVISTGTTGYEGPAPATEAEMLALLKKYGGE